MAYAKLSDFISELQEKLKLLESKDADCPERARKIETLKGCIANLEEHRGTPFYS